MFNCAREEDWPDPMEELLGDRTMGAIPFNSSTSVISTNGSSAAGATDQAHLQPKRPRLEAGVDSEQPLPLKMALARNTVLAP